MTNHISHRVGEDASRHRGSSQGGGGGEPRGREIILYFNFIFAKELFAELDKEEDGIVYTKSLIIQLRALNEDLDKNLKVYSGC